MNKNNTPCRDTWRVSKKNNNLGIIIVAGGTGNRFGKENKLLEYISKYPVFIHSLLNFRGSCPDNQMVLVCHPDSINEYKKLADKFVPNNDFVYIKGGTERYNSVINGLNALPDHIEYVAIHDAARPLANKKLLNNCLESCKKLGSGIAAKKINDTIKSADKNGKITKTIDRENLWSIETPQVFKLEELKAAYQKIIKDKITVTDDAGAMEYTGYPVYLVENFDINTKITHQSDIKYIKAIM